MTTRCSSPRLVWLGLALAACAPSRPTPTSHATAVGVTTASEPLPQRLPRPASSSQSTAANYGRWSEISRGDGNGHALWNVRIATVTVLASNDLAKSYYCEGRKLEDDATFGIAEAMVQDGERRLYYVIERARSGDWEYRIDIDGETIVGSPLCANCHEQGRADPFFRAFGSPACR